MVDVPYMNDVLRLKLCLGDYILFSDLQQIVDSG